jgi:hypothetical protein
MSLDFASETLAELQEGDARAARKYAEAELPPLNSGPQDGMLCAI